MDKRGKYIYDWPRAMITVDIIVFGSFENNFKLLLIKRGREPFKGKWALPGGFVGMDEELEDSAERELAEETGMSNVPLEQMYTFGRCGRDPRGRQISITFMSVVTKSSKRIKAGYDAIMARWFDIDNLPKDMAFDHNEIVKFGVKRLKRKKIYRQVTK